MQKVSILESTTKLLGYFNLLEESFHTTPIFNQINFYFYHKKVNLRKASYSVASKCGGAFKICIKIIYLTSSVL